MNEYTLLDALKASAGIPIKTAAEELAAERAAREKAEARVKELEQDLADHKTALNTLEVLYTERGEELKTAAREKGESR